MAVIKLLSCVWFLEKVYHVWVEGWTFSFTDFYCAFDFFSSFFFHSEICLICSLNAKIFSYFEWLSNNCEDSIISSNQRMTLIRPQSMKKRLFMQNHNFRSDWIHVYKACSTSHSEREKQLWGSEKYAWSVKISHFT